MDIVFVYDNRKNELKNESNGTMLLATKLLQAGYSVQIYRFAQNSEYLKNKDDRDYYRFIDLAVSAILNMSPRCVSFYTLWPSYHIMLRIAAEIKKRAPQVITVMGGPQASATAWHSMNAAPYVDYICTGEGENTVVPFFSGIFADSCGNVEGIPGLYYRKNGQICQNRDVLPLCDLNTLPRWDERLYAGDYRESQEKMRSLRYYMPIDTGRGCPYSCTFCCTSDFWRRTYRLKSAEKIIEEIEYYHNKFGIRSFAFSHDAFTVNQKLVTEVCDLIVERKLNIVWRCTTRIDCISEELLLKMKSAGMTEIHLGIETGSERMQKLINKRLDLRKAKEKVAFILKNRISVGLFFMYGFPEETTEDLKATMDFLFEMIGLGVRLTTMSFCTFCPATALVEKYADDLCFTPNDKNLARDYFGFEEEKNLISANRDIFPFFYHLHTPVRDSYEHLSCLNYLYIHYPNSVKQLVHLYGGDHLKLYKDIVLANGDIFENAVYSVNESVLNRSLEVLNNTVSMCNTDNAVQLKALFQFDYDYQMLVNGEDGAMVRNRYDFSFIEFQLKLPIEQYTSGWTELLMKKVGDSIKIKVVAIS